MIIENAERLGLAQLHQLRGRVGRGSTASACVLMYQGKLSANGRARLAAMRETCDGFEIARRDLELRGPGELLGTRQTGLLQLRIADLSRDADLLDQVPALAAEIEAETRIDSATADTTLGWRCHELWRCLNKQVKFQVQVSRLIIKCPTSR